MDHDKPAVRALMDVELDRIDALLAQVAEARQAILRPKIASAAMPGNENHDQSLFAAVDKTLDEPALQQ
ncbi:hypothetical protein ACVI1J_008075 [Bradyrhizobium diazoefficiens]|uniref:hypothetical protein n=1 Tax=Bradyrhizobium TaxID=374 RepID=UPI0035989630